jgi:methyl-accepting chemotaxis protein
MVKAATLIVTLAVLLSACGGNGADSRAKALYNTYRATEDRRNEAESRLREAFADISSAASKEDSAGVVAAAKRGQKAIEDINDLLSPELEAANDLKQVPEVSKDAAKLADGLQLTRDSLALVAKELEIALDDPLLARRGKEVNDLAEKATDLAVKGEVAIRRADRAIALALGLEPRLDLMFTTTTPGTTTG